jgi:hypothetical protein
MSSRGNDLVRRYLWMAALSAVRFNPAVRALYARVVAKHPDQKAIAIGHAMRKLLHLVFAIWKTKKPFDANFYPWDAPAHIARQDEHEPTAAQEQAAGLTCPLPRSGRIFWRMLPNWHPIGGCLLHLEFGKRSYVRRNFTPHPAQ